MPSTLQIASFVLTLLAYAPLWARIIRESAVPVSHRQPLPKATWLSWLLADLCLAATGRGVHALQMWAYVAGTGSIACYAFRHGTSGWSKTDRRVIALSASSLAAWCLTGGLPASILIVAATAVGAYPLCQELWLDPGAEGALAWWLFWFGSLANLADIDWNLTKMLAPAGFFALQTFIIALTLRRSPRVCEIPLPQPRAGKRTDLALEFCRIAS